MVIYCTYNQILFGFLCILGPLYTAVEKCTGQSRISAQDIARDGMMEKRKGQ